MSLKVLAKLDLSVMTYKQTEQALKSSIVEKRLALIKGLVCFEAVSYTHLDVYKRQDLYYVKSDECKG